MDRPLRLALVTRQYPPHAVGGIGSYVATVARLLAAAGHDVTVISAAPGQARSTAVEDGVRVERLPAAGPTWLWDPLLRRWSRGGTRVHAAVSALVALRRAARGRPRFDVIEAPEWKAEGLLLRAARRGPVVVHLHLAQEIAALSAGRDRGRRIAERLERASARAARVVTAASTTTTTRPDGTSWLDDVRRVAPPVDLARWAECPPVSVTGPIVLLLGRLEHIKAPDVLLAAMAHLAADVPGARLVCAGKPYTSPDGRPYDEWLRSEAARLGVDVDVRPPTADRAEVLALFGAARVVAVPSRFETLSLVALEAMACGRPVVMSDRVGAREWVGEDDGVTVVPVEDAGALAAALRPHLLDVTVAVDAGSRAKAAVARVCSPDEVVRTRLAAYEAAARR